MTWTSRVALDPKLRRLERAGLDDEVAPLLQIGGGMMWGAAIALSARSTPLAGLP